MSRPNLANFADILTRVRARASEARANMAAGRPPERQVRGLAAAMQRDLCAEWRMGHMPEWPKTFRDIHDYFDANELGADHDAHSDLAVWNAAATVVDARLRAGKVRCGPRPTERQLAELDREMELEGEAEADYQRWR